MAIAATISMIAFGIGCYGLHLRIRESDIVWKEECASMSTSYHPSSSSQDRDFHSKGIGNRPGSGIIGNFRASRASMDQWEYGSAKRVSVSRDQSGKPTMQVYGAGQPIVVNEDGKNFLDADAEELRDDDSTMVNGPKHTLKPRS